MRPPVRSTPPSSWTKPNEPPLFLSPTAGDRLAKQGRGPAPLHHPVRPLLSIIIPAFNEEARIGPTLDAIVEYLDAQPYSWEVMVVDDGSSDATSEGVAERARALGGVSLQRIPHRGKGWAVRHGMLASSGAYRLMCDADLAMPVELIASFIERMEDGYDAVIGSRQAPGARRYNEPLMRHVRGRVFNMLVRLAVVGGYADTQCGFKCFRAEQAETLFRLQKTRGLAFDVELLYLARKQGLKVVEIPIDWYHDRDSKVRTGVDSLSMFIDALRVRVRDLTGGYVLEDGD